MEVVCLTLGVMLTLLTANLALSFKEKSANDMYAGYESLIEFSAGDFDKSINYFYIPCYSDKNVQTVEQNKNIKLLTGYKNLKLDDQIVFMSNKNISYIGNDIVGANPDVVQILNASLKSGKNLLGEHQIIIGANINQRWGIDVDDIVKIPVNGKYVDYKVTGVLNHKPESIFDTKAEVLNNILLINQADQILSNVKYSAILASVYDTDKINETGNDLVKELSKDEAVIQTLKNLDYKPVAATRKNVALLIVHYVEYASLFIYLFTAIVYSITIAFIASSAAMQMIEQSKEVGILSAIGLTRGQIVFINMFSSIFIGLSSLLLGTSFSLAIEIFVCKALAWTVHFDFVSLLMAIVMCLIILPLIGIYYGRKQFKSSVLTLLKNRSGGI